MLDDPTRAPQWARVLCGHTGELSANCRTILWTNLATVGLDLVFVLLTAVLDTLTKEDFSTLVNVVLAVPILLALIYYLPRRNLIVYSLARGASGGMAALYVISLAFEIRAAVVKAWHELWIGIAITDALCLIMWLQIMYYVRLLVKQWQVDSLLH